MKKILLPFLIILLSAVVSRAANSFYIDQLEYTVTSKENLEVSVKALTYDISGDIVIPAQVTYDSKTYSVTSIAEFGFIGRRNLLTVIIPESVMAIGDYAFEGCSALTSVDIPDSVTKIGMEAFSDCISLSSLELPGSVTEIGSSAFNSCSELKSIFIPAAVMEIGDGALYGCTGMTEITVDANNQNYSSVDGILYNKDASVLMVCPPGKSAEVAVPESVVEIDNWAFSNCGELTSIVLPSTVKSIGDCVFVACNALTSLRIPGSVTEIGKQAFFECTSLAEIIVDDDNCIFSSSDGVLMNKEQSIVISCPMGKTGKYVIPGTAVLIQESAFRDCTGLSSVIIPGSVFEIDNQAFYGCAGLTEIVIPNSVVYIGASVFSGCSNLSSVNLPESISTLDNGIFSGCSSLTSVVIPGTITRIGLNAFSGCTGLTSIRIPASVNSYEGNPFSGCTSLTDIMVDGHNESFCSVDGVVYTKDMATLKSYPAALCGEYFIPESVARIGDSAFSGCEGLSSVHVPASVKYVEQSAFKGCTSLAGVYCERESPANASTIAFDKYTLEEGILYVPEIALSEYQNIYPWSWFRNIQAYDPSGISDVMEDDAVLPVEIYGLNGVYMGSSAESLSPGLYIKRQGHTTEKIIVR